MSKTNFSVPSLPLRTVYEDYRDNYKGGYGWRTNIDLAKVQFVAIHHTVTKPKNNLKAEVDEVFNIHTKTRGWGGIGYNFIVSTEVDSATGFARCAYVGDLGSARAHTPNAKGAFGIRKNAGNAHILAICIVGDFSNSQPSDAQLRTVHEIAKELIFNEDKRLPALKDWNNLKRHKDFDPTVCCGNWDLNLVINPPAFNKPTVEPVLPPVNPPIPPVVENPLQSEVNKLREELNLARDTISKLEKNLQIAKETYQLSTKQQLDEISRLQQAQIQLEKELQKSREEKVKEKEKDRFDFLTEIRELTEKNRKLAKENNQKLKLNPFNWFRF
jgi:hypothetical protein